MIKFIVREVLELLAITAMMAVLVWMLARAI